MRRVVLMFASALLLVSFTVPAAAQTAEPQTYWWNDRVFYEIFVRSFNDSDGDGIGDIQGIIDRLDYLNDGDPNTTDDLGITGIWLMPIMESPSYHGYDVTNYGRINPDYGSFADMRRLMEEAHARGIAVIVDMVINHTSNRHPWFIASAESDPRYAGWYIWRPANPNYRGPDGQNVWHGRGGRFYYGLFVDSMPDLNLANPDVTDAIYDIARMWINVVGVDGFRLDAIKHLIEEGREQESTPSTIAWLEAYHDFIDTLNPDALTVGEVWESNFISSQYVPEGVDLTFDFDFAGAILTTVNTQRPGAINTVLERATRIYPYQQYATFITNHDQNRVMSMLSGNIDQARIAASLLLTTPGVPFIYYGEEIGMTGVKPDIRIRTPFRWDETETTAGFTSARRPWEVLSEDAPEVSVASETDDPMSLLSHYRALIQLRAAHPALAIGELGLVETDGSPSVYAFIRRTDDEMILVLMNLSSDAITDYTVQPITETSTMQVLYGMSADGAITTYAPGDSLPAYTTLILQFSGE